MPDRFTPLGIVPLCQRVHDRTDEGTAQATDQYQCLKKPSGKLDRWKHIRDVCHSHIIEALQKVDPVVVTKPRVSYEHNIAGMPGIDPLVDYRCNMIYVVIMTEEKKRFHPRILILRMSATSGIPII